MKCSKCSKKAKPCGLSCPDWPGHVSTHEAAGHASTHEAAGSCAGSTTAGAAAYWIADTMGGGTPRHDMGASTLPSSSGSKHATPADVLGPAAAQGSGQPTAATVEPGARARNERKRLSRDLDAEAPKWSALRAKAPLVLRRRVADDFGDKDAHPDSEAGKSGEAGETVNITL